MHCVLVGPGALGCLLSSMLAKSVNTADCRFTLLDHDSDRAGHIASEGIRYRFKDAGQRVHLPVSSSPVDIGHADVVILCVKSYDIKACLGFCSPLLGSGTLLLFMQNGIAHLDVEGYTGDSTPAYGTTTEGATRTGPGEVLHAGKGLTQLGFLGPVSPGDLATLEATAGIFNQAGLKTRIRNDILSRLWTKLLVNTGINGLTATLDCANGELLNLPGVDQRMARLVKEAADVAMAGNIDIPDNALEITHEVCAKTATNISSMLQDVRSGRRTEIDAINGAVVVSGSKLGIETPENSRLVQQVKLLEQSYLKRNYSRGT